MPPGDIHNKQYNSDECGSNKVSFTMCHYIRSAHASSIATLQISCLLRYFEPRCTLSSRLCPKVDYGSFTKRIATTTTPIQTCPDAFNVAKVFFPRPSISSFNTRFALRQALLVTTMACKTMELWGCGLNSGHQVDIYKKQYRHPSECKIDKEEINLIDFTCLFMAPKIRIVHISSACILSKSNL